MATTDRPHVRVFQGDTCSYFPPTAYEALTHALQEGEVWWEGETIYGNAMLVRLSSVTDVHLMTAEGLAAIRADSETQPWET